MTPTTLAAVGASVERLFVFTYNVASQTSRSIELSADGPASLTIGRSPACQLVVSDQTISRQHAELEVRDGRCFLRDLGSTAGTLVNGQRVAGACELADGDRFSIGAVLFSCAVKERARVSLVEPHESEPDPSRYTIARRVDVAPPRIDQEGSAEAARLTRLLSEIGQTLVSARELGDVLQRVIDLVFEAVAAERAVLLLRDSAYDALTPRAGRYADGRPLGPLTLSRTIVSTVLRERVAMLATDAMDDRRLDFSGSIAGLNIRSFICAPLWNRNDVIGVLYVDTPKCRTFREEDLTVFVALANYAAVAIEQARLAERVNEETQKRERLQRYHSPAVVNRILTGQQEAQTLDAHVREVTVMFTDLVGFTAMSEHMAPAEVAATLNEFFGVMTDVIFDHQGTLDKYIGDAMLAVFGAPIPEPQHADHAVRAALRMQAALRELNARRPNQQLRMRIAINSGPALVGDIGSPRRREFTVLGDTVNTASRLESSVAAPGQIVISKATWERLGGGFRASSLGQVTLRGRETPLEAFVVEE